MNEKAPEVGSFRELASVLDETMETEANMSPERVKSGEAFVDFCNKVSPTGENTENSTFEAKLKEMGISPTEIKKCLRHSGDLNERIILYDKDPKEVGIVANMQYFRVEVNKINFLFPKATNSTKFFERVPKGFEIEEKSKEELTPETISFCIPAIIERFGDNQWKVVKEGVLSSTRPKKDKKPAQKQETERIVLPPRLEIKEKKPSPTPQPTNTPKETPKTEIEGTKVAIEQLRKIIQESMAQLEANKKATEQDTLLIASLRQELEQLRTKNEKEEEVSSDAEKIGNFFVELYQTYSILDLDILIPFFKEKLPSAQVKFVYLPSDSDALSFYKIRQETSSDDYVLITLGDNNYLVPRGEGPERFGSTRGFTCDASVVPKNVIKVIPAEVVWKGRSWQIKTLGKIS